MYAHPKTGQAAADTAAPTSNAYYVGTLRRNLLAVVIGNDLFTPEEQLRANHNTHECQCPRRLALWLKNTRRVAAEREHAESLRLLAVGIERFEAKLTAAQPTVAAALAPVPVLWATANQCDEIFRLACLPCFTAGEKASTLRGLVTLTQQGAVQEIGQLYATVLRRNGRLSWRATSTLLAA